MKSSARLAVIMVFTVAVLVTMSVTYVTQAGTLTGGEQGSVSQPTALSAEENQQLAQPQIDELTTRIEKNPQDVDSIIELANLYYDTQQFEQAIEYYGKALEISPDNTSVRTDMGSAYFYIGKTAEAREVFRKVLEIDPNKVQAHYNLGLALAHGDQSDPKAAIAEWNKVIELAPDSQEATSAKQLIESFSKSE